MVEYRTTVSLSQKGTSACKGNSLPYKMETLVAANSTTSLNESLYANGSSFVNEVNEVLFNEQGGSGNAMSTINAAIRTTTLILLPVLFVIGIFGNVLTLAVIGLNEMFCSMASRYILVLLACCDMTMLLTHPFNRQGIIQTIGLDVRALSTIGCKLFFHVYRTTKMVSSWLVVMLCVERFFAVVYPLKVKVFITRGRVIFLITSTFLLLNAFNGVWSFSTMVIGSAGKRQCKQMVETEANSVMFRTFLVISEAIFSWVPVSVMVTLTPIIVYKLVVKVKLRRQMSVTSSGSDSRTTRITAMLICVVIAYVILIFPVTLFHINKSFYSLGLKPNTASFAIVREVVQYLEVVNYATNFIMYAFSSVEFRNKAAALLCRPRNRAGRVQIMESTGWATDMTSNEQKSEAF